MNLKNKFKKLVFRFEILFRNVENNNGSLPVLLFDTSIDSENLGDYIINDYCNQILQEIKIKPFARVATHRLQTREELENLALPSLKLVTGTNILSSKIYSQWIRPSKLKLQDNVLLMGVGWTNYNTNVSYLSKKYYQKILNKDLKHCVRDKMTKEVLNSIGIKNVLYTGCPTMWKLTPEFCKFIPIAKADNVICTVTDYSQDSVNDFLMLDILIENYDKVYFWPQGKFDLEYISNYSYKDKLIILEESLEAYDDLLNKENSLDYVGTRLHAGIRALNNRIRTLVIAVDNRAKEISSDTGLHTINREDIGTKLRKQIKNDYFTKINLPFDAIKEWKEQFNEQ
ncbi:MAG: polysaccharide pyruvyl transferase family protein [Amedibacillus dolichus]|uniref:Polysaccharide pyruvyl transferase family protein n=1 Tax=Amedibacillus dolichus TaxID=31971 RepID=A0A942W9I6_9FIRM|nr:polysaccharide pyruvyl transferase family protein [Amedibacillus dolichus]MBS4884438.1 polysaccharide pyruvyl transferase family protein [Amedibacillus dolichus]